MSKYMSENLSHRIPDKMPEDLPNRMPEDISDRMPEDLPDKIPKDMPDRMPENLPDRISEDMLEYIPEDMPNRMPEDMSDRMPEDLRVTKCVNVMVGITRSKVISIDPYMFGDLYFFVFHHPSSNVPMSDPYQHGLPSGQLRMYRPLGNCIVPQILGGRSLF